MNLDLPMIWAVIIATAVFLYVVLDGFDLGVGILFPFASDSERDVMVASIAPVWDGNETWLVLGGGGLFAAFPLAYATLMPAMYLPIGFMLTALIFRGVAFEFRAKAGPRGRRFWTAAFAGGSLVAGLSQGLVLGGFLKGIEVEGRNFAGGHWDWLSPFSLLVAASLAVGYALLGACWLILKAEGDLNAKARRWARGLAVGVAFAMFAVSLAMLSVDPTVAAHWGVTMRSIDWSVFLVVAPLPLLAGVSILLCWWHAGPRGSEKVPMLAAIGIFVTGFLGLALSTYPNIIPYDITIREAAAADNSLALMLVGVAIMLPVILGYTAYVYWVFRGKVTADAAYH
jgi:cytochrome d ubiquinol oxidase subunit II